MVSDLLASRSPKDLCARKTICLVLFEKAFIQEKLQKPVNVKFAWKLKTVAWILLYGTRSWILLLKVLCNVLENKFGSYWLEYLLSSMTLWIKTWTERSWFNSHRVETTTVFWQEQISHPLSVKQLDQWSDLCRPCHSCTFLYLN